MTKPNKPVDFGYLFSVALVVFTVIAAFVIGCAMGTTTSFGGIVGGLAAGTALALSWGTFARVWLGV